MKSPECVGMGERRQKTPRRKGRGQSLWRDENYFLKQTNNPPKQKCTGKHSPVFRFLPLSGQVKWPHMGLADCPACLPLWSAGIALGVFPWSPPCPGRQVLGEIGAVRGVWKKCRCTHVSRAGSKPSFCCETAKVLRRKCVLLYVASWLPFLWQIQDTHALSQARR